MCERRKHVMFCEKEKDSLKLPSYRKPIYFSALCLLWSINAEKVIRIWQDIIWTKWHEKSLNIGTWHDFYVKNYVCMCVLCVVCEGGFEGCTLIGCIPIWSNFKFPLLAIKFHRYNHWISLFSNIDNVCKKIKTIGYV